MIQIRAGMPSASYQQHLKDQNATLLFDLVRRRAPISRAELTKASGLSAATVTVLVDELLQGGWLVELGAVGSTARGRRPINLAVNAARGAVATLEILSNGSILSVYDICLHKLTQTRSRLPASTSAPIIAQLRAQRGRAERAAREEKHRSAAAHRRSRVARRAVGGDERPVLPGAAQTRGQKLHAGNARQHPRRNAVFRQQRQQAARAGIKARVAAVRHNAQGGVSPRFQHGLQHLLRARCFHSARRAARGQRGQQPPRADDAFRRRQRPGALRRHRSGRAAAHCRQNHLHAIISLHSFKTAA